MNKQAQDPMAAARKAQVDRTVDDMATVSGDRIKSEIKKRKVVPNTLANQIQKALG